MAYTPSTYTQGQVLNADDVNRLGRGIAASSDLGPSPALEPWLLALANRANAPARVLSLGDSITEGANATTNQRRWVQRFLTECRARFPQAPVGGFGHLPPYYIGTTMGQPWTSMSDPSTPTDNTFGLGRRCALLSGSRSYTYTVTGTSVWVWYASGPSSGTLSVVIDGGAAATTATAGTLADGKVWVSPALSAGTHTVTVSASSGTIYFTGVTVFNGDENAGVQMFEAGHWGWKTTDWVNNGAYWPATLGPIQPQLVTIALMTNDYQAGVDPVTAQANIASMISAMRAQCSVPPTFALVVYPARGDVTNPAFPWSAYVAAACNIAASDPGVVVLDLSARYTSPAVSNALGTWSGDKVHPADKGHGLIATTLLQLLSPR